MSSKITSMGDFFKEAFGVSYKRMKKNVPKEVKKENVMIKSYDGTSIVFKRVLNLIRKDSTLGFIVKTSTNEFVCSPNHKLGLILDGDTTLSWIEVKDFIKLNKKASLITEEGLEENFEINSTHEETEILDIEVEDTHCYFSNGVLSHNTLYGNPECVTPDCLVNLIDKKVSMKGLFAIAGVNYLGLHQKESIDISSQNILIESFNHETKKNEFKRILSLVRKENIEETFSFYKLDTKEKVFSCSPAHKVFIPIKNQYAPVSDFEDNEIITLKGIGESNVSGFFKREKEENEILDLQVEDNHNYFTNGVLSHNTQPGGNALKFAASGRFEVRKIENIVGKNADDVIGIKTRFKNIKNKVGIPFRKGEISIYYATGIDTRNEYIELASEIGLTTGSKKNYYAFEGEEIFGFPKYKEWFKDEAKFQRLKVLVDEALLNPDKKEEEILESGKTELEAEELIGDIPDFIDNTEESVDE